MQWTASIILALYCAHHIDALLPYAVGSARHIDAVLPHTVGSAHHFDAVLPHTWTVPIILTL